MIHSCETVFSRKRLPLWILLSRFIISLKAQKYWSCDEDCPLKCSKGDDDVTRPLCCFIPDVTVMAVTFASQCHFNCANKCYSYGLKVNNEGDCYALPTSSESGSFSEEDFASESYEDDGEPDVFAEAEEGKDFEKVDVTLAELQLTASHNDPSKMKRGRTNVQNKEPNEIATTEANEDNEDNNDGVEQIGKMEGANDINTATESKNEQQDEWDKATLKKKSVSSVILLPSFNYARSIVPRSDKYK